MLSSEQEVVRSDPRTVGPSVSFHIDAGIGSILTILLILVFVYLDNTAERNLLIAYHLSVQLM